MFPLSCTSGLDYEIVTIKLTRLLDDATENQLRETEINIGICYPQWAEAVRRQRIRRSLL